MTFYATIAITGYLVISFILTALYVRFAQSTRLVTTTRKYLYLFPVIPILLLLDLLMRGARLLTGTAAQLVRRAFEKLSGKKTYRKRSVYDKY